MLQKCPKNLKVFHFRARLNFLPLYHNLSYHLQQVYGKSSAQVALRFLIQSDVVVIPKSTHRERMEQNLNVFDFALDDGDMEAIRKLDEGESLFFNHYDPATVEMLTNMGKTRRV